MLRRFTVFRSGKASVSGDARRCCLVLALFACAEADGTTNTPGAAGAGADNPAGGAAGARAATLTDAEWQALTAPQPGVHEVYDAACEGQPISQDYRIVPGIGCAVRRDENGVYTPTRDCDIIDYCTTAADCSTQARGVCVGHASSSCQYENVEVGAPCERDADCTALPGGTCAVQIAGGEQFCYPTGECISTPMQGCSYPALSQSCAVDADCSAAPGGSCRHTIAPSECAYNECDTASDCGPAARCECLGVRQCIPSDCFADTDCQAGYRCEPTPALVCGNLIPIAGYNCHAPDDECQSDADCDNLSCVFDPAVSHWACRDTVCYTR